jgi:hypothetical protein
MFRFHQQAGIAQLGERQTEDLKVACSIHAHRILNFLTFSFFPTVLLPRFLFNPRFSSALPAAAASTPVQLRLQHTSAFKLGRKPSQTVIVYSFLLINRAPILRLWIRSSMQPKGRT